MKPIKILYVEDHEMVRESIKLILNSQVSLKVEIDDACDGLEAINKALEKKYDVILLDINLPLKDGIYVAKFLKSKINNVRILALSTHTEEFVVRQMIESGALGFILKTCSVEELIKAIRTVASFERYYCNNVAQILLKKSKKQIDKTYQNIDNNTFSNIPVTQRELEILKHIALEYTNKEIGNKLNISERTVGNHRNKLIQKLLVKNSIGLATYAVKNGLI